MYFVEKIKKINLGHVTATLLNTNQVFLGNFNLKKRRDSEISKSLFFMHFETNKLILFSST